MAERTLVDKLKLLWLSPKVEFSGRGIIDAWGTEMERAGWKTVSEPPCDLAFFGSDSQLREDLIGKYPTIAYFWGYDPARLLDGSFRAWAQPQLEMLARCTRVLVPGPLTQYQLADWGIPSQICVPGIDTRTLTVPEPPPARCNRVMFLSRLASHKGLETLIEAISMLQPQPELLVCGPGDRGPYEALANDLKVKVEWHELGDSDKAIALASSMVLVHPSRYEGFGMPPLEALACGTPALVSAIPQHLWLLKDKGIYFESAQDLAEALAAILSNPLPALKAAERAQAWVRQELSLEKACERLWPFLHQAIKQYWGERVKADPENRELVKEAYEAEHRRNYAYGQADIAGYNGPARFDPTWARHFRSAYFIQELKAASAKTVLDIGTGPVYCTIFARAGFDVTGFDVSDECLFQARAIAEKWGVADKVSTQQGYAEELPYADNTQEAVVLGEILEHVPDPGKVLGEALRVLKPGGVLIASSPIANHHYDPFHAGPAAGGWDDASLEKLLAPWRQMVTKVERIAEAGTDPSCFLVVMRKPA